MLKTHSTIVTVFILSMGLLLGCQRAEHRHSDVSVEPILRRAYGACLARIVKLEDHDDWQPDGDHWIEAWLEVEEATGEVPQSLYLVVEQGGGHATIESFQQAKKNLQTRVLRHDSLKQGERHWFVFSADNDPAKYPPGIAGWWRDADGDVPYDVVAAIEHDRFADHPQWDKQRNLVTTWWQNRDQVTVCVRQADSLDPESALFGETFQGEFKSLSLSHAPIGYGMDGPPGKPVCYVQLEIVGTLAEGNEFGLPPGDYRLRYAYDLETGKLAATWIAENKPAWLMVAFRQYDLESGQVSITMDFDLLETGGIEAGGDTPNWYRRIVKKYEAGELLREDTFRHRHIKTGQEPIDCSEDWFAVSQ